MKLFDDLARLWWVTLPAGAGRVYALLARLMTDGAYLNAWKPAAALAPPGALFVGLIAGWTHFSSSHYALAYTDSLVLMGLMVVASGLGGGLGFWLAVGYAAGDLLLFPNHGVTYNAFDSLMGYLALPIAWLLLGKLVCLAPAIARGLRLQLVGRLRLGGAPGAVVHAGLQGAIQAALVWVWVLAAPTLIRPVFTWRGNDPTREAMAPLQGSGGALIALGLGMGIARAILARRLDAQRAEGEAGAALAAAERGRKALTWPALPVWLMAVGRSLFATYLLSGLIANVIEAALFFGLTVAGQLLRGFVATRLAPLARFMGRVPMILRLAAGGLLSFALASLLVPLAWNRTETFFPIMIPTATSMVVFALLMPAPPPPAAPAPTVFLEARR